MMGYQPGLSLGLIVKKSPHPNNLKDNTYKKVGPKFGAHLVIRYFKLQV